MRNYLQHLTHRDASQGQFQDSDFDIARLILIVQLNCAAYLVKHLYAVIKTKKKKQFTKFERKIAHDLNDR